METTQNKTTQVTKLYQILDTQMHNDFYFYLFSSRIVNSYDILVNSLTELKSNIFHYFIIMYFIIDNLLLIDFLKQWFILLDSPYEMVRRYYQQGYLSEICRPVPSSGS